MGIRIHKTIGYGLTDVKSEEFNIVDERFNQLGFYFASDEDQEKFWTTNGLFSFGKSLPEYERPFLWREQLTRKKDGYTQEWGMWHSIVYEPEYGEDNVFVLIPPGHWDWSRYDNIIDYVEDVHLNDGPKNYVKELPYGIWPYSTLYMDKKSPYRRFDSAYALEFKRRIEYCQKLFGNTFFPQTAFDIYWSGERLAKYMGFDGYFDAVDNLSPLIPTEIVALCKYLNLFNDEATIYTLKPLLYVYWG